MVFCSKCGHGIDAGVQFCPGCGSASPAAGAASAAPVSHQPYDSGAQHKSHTAGNLPDFGPGYTGGWAKRAEGGSKKTKIGSRDDGNNPTPAVIQGVKRLYKEKVLPLEAMFKFPEFHSPSLTDTDFEAKPMVLLIGQYSTGKTSFIRFLLEQDFPGSHIGPEPTTDRFTAIMQGPEKIIPGNALAAATDRPFTALTKFGMAFLNRFEAAQCNAPILNKLIFIDTPGVLSGEKQRVNRGYNFTEVIGWFAERVDRILLLFDAHKLDISDEFREAILVLKGHDDKIRCILNKADLVNEQALIRVYGALMWSLGKVIATPEVLRVYMGSFWDQPLKNKSLEKLFNAEQADLLADLRSLPRNSTIRKMNELIKRTRMLKVHVHLLDHIQGQFGTFGKKKTQEKLLKNLLDVFKAVQQATGLPAGDFPHMASFRERLGHHDCSQFPKLKNKKIRKLVEELDQALSVDIPRLMRMVPGANGQSEDGASGEAFNPFSSESDHAAVNTAWAVDRANKSRYDTIFNQQELVEGKLSGQAARVVLSKSRLSNEVLYKVWMLADCDADGWLDADEFAVAMCLIDCHTQGLCPEMPENLPATLVPPSKRHFFDF